MQAAQFSPGASFEPTVALASNALQTSLRGPPGGSSQAVNDTPAALLRQAVHDLRGLFSVVSTATTVLQRPSSNERREVLLAGLHRNVGGTCQLLIGVADLARLDATQEQASSELGGPGGGVRELAACGGIQLESQGSRQLLVESDALMVTRMLQNLNLNAINYTQAGGVALTRGACEDTPAGGLWYFEIVDLSCIAADINGPQLPAAPGPAAAWTPGAGEGIGLSIVRRGSGVPGGRMRTVCKGTVRSTRIERPRRYAGSLEELTFSATEPGHSRGGAARTTDPSIANNPRRAS